MKTTLGLIVTFNPTPDLFSALDSFYTQLDRVLIVDNGSNPATRHQLEQEAKRRETSLVVLFNGTNLGIATALNQGFRWAIDRGYDCVLTFDQDSIPAPGMVSIMLEVYAAHSMDGFLAVVAPIVIDPVVNIQARFLRPKNKLLFERVPCSGEVLENVTYVITSGSLCDLAVYQRIGPFRDDFFIDYVDTEYCLRANKCGYRILVACNARLNHRQGERQKRTILGYEHYPTFHSPLRWYYSSRNRIAILRQYALRCPHWLVYEMVASLYTMTKMILFETQKPAKLRAFLLGTLDGLRGHMGRASDGFETVN